MTQVQDVGGIVERLLGFLETGRDFVTAEAVIQLKDLLRRYPAIAEASLSSVSSITPEASVWPPLRQPLQELPGLRGLGASTPEQLSRMAAARRSMIIQEELFMTVPTHGWSRGPQMLGCTAQDIVEPEARAAFVWILGEYGQNIQVPPVTCFVGAHHQLVSLCTPSQWPNLLQADDRAMHGLCSTIMLSHLGS